MIERRSLISPEHERLSIAGQCKLLDLQRSYYYFKSKGESIFNQSIMNAIDRKFPNAAQQNLYVIFKKNDVSYDVNGICAADPAAHIPLNKFNMNKMPKFD